MPTTWAAARSPRRVEMLTRLHIERRTRSPGPRTSIKFRAILYTPFLTYLNARPAAATALTHRSASLFYRFTALRLHGREATQHPPTQPGTPAPRSRSLLGTPPAGPAAAAQHTGRTTRRQAPAHRAIMKS